MSAARAECCSSKTARCRSSARSTGSRSARLATGRYSVSTRRFRFRTAPARPERAPSRRRSNGCSFAHAGPASVIGRTAELLVQRIRGRVNGLGAALQIGQARTRSGGGRTERPPRQRRRHRVQSGRSRSRHVARVVAAARAVRHSGNPPPADSQLPAARHAARQNSRPRLSRAARRCVSPLLPDSGPRQARSRGRLAAVAASTPSSSGTRAWNQARRCPRTRNILRAHVLELPIHQDLTTRQILHVARHASAVATGRGA